MGPVAKESVTIRVDRDVWSSFKTGERGKQTRINALLKACVKAKQSRNGLSVLPL